MSALISPLKKSSAIIFVLGIVLLISCNKAEPSASLPTRTVIVYMVANNNLYQNAINNINEMERGWGDFNGHLIVYLCPENEDPYLLEIQNDNSNEIISKVVKRYSPQKSCDILVMQSVYKDIMELYPAQSYGTILWSQATGWLPSDIPSILTSQKALVSQDGPFLKSFGDDNGEKMEIENLAKALPVNLDFIIFDACLMAGVESVYELRNNADYILASSTEVQNAGYPYNEIMAYLFLPKADLVSIADKYFNYYDEKEGLYRSATVSIMKTSELEGLAASCRQIIENNEIPNSINLGDIQKLDTWHNPVFFGFMSYMKSAYSGVNLSALENQLSKVILYKKCTPKFFNEIELKEHCGLSSYIPNTHSGSLNNAYYKTEWAQASGFIKFQQYAQ